MENIKNSNIDSNEGDIHIEEKDSREFDFGPNLFSEEEISEKKSHLEKMIKNFNENTSIEVNSKIESQEDRNNKINEIRSSLGL